MKTRRTEYILPTTSTTSRTKRSQDVPKPRAQKVSAKKLKSRVQFLGQQSTPQHQPTSPIQHTPAHHSPPLRTPHLTRSVSHTTKKIPVVNQCRKTWEILIKKTKEHLRGTRVYDPLKEEILKLEKIHDLDLLTDEEAQTLLPDLRELSKKMDDLIQCEKFKEVFLQVELLDSDDENSDDDEIEDGGYRDSLLQHSSEEVQLEFKRLEGSYPSNLEESQKLVKDFRQLMIASIDALTEKLEKNDGDEIRSELQQWENEVNQTIHYGK